MNPPQFLRSTILVAVGAILTGGACAVYSKGKSSEEPAAQSGGTLTGKAAMGDWSTDAPGSRRKITVADLPKPYATRSVDNGPNQVQRPEGAWPKVPKGFKVEEFIT